MEYNTSELCDTYGDLIDVVEPMLANFGGLSSFGGQIVTIKCFEDNGLIQELVQQSGLGKVLLIDGGGSLRRALIDLQNKPWRMIGKGSSAMAVSEMLMLFLNLK